KKDFYRSEHQKRKDEFCPFSSLADFNPLQLTKSPKNFLPNKKELSNQTLLNSLKLSHHLY
ncbi:hypothetical protein, partial [Streptococcus pneumoniae]|uniref:hypothetical protein n=1 Tax=Streptococcus pneumoniae TaxID=1313 RepID=UPI001CECA87F